MGIILSQNRSKREIHPSPYQNLCLNCHNFNRLVNNSLCEECYRQYSMIESKNSFRSNWICKYCQMKNENKERSCCRCGRNSIIKRKTRPMSVSIIHRREQDQSNAQLLFENILSFCHENQIHFVDDQFPPTCQSLGPKVKENATKWLRICDIRPSSMDDWNRPWEIVNCKTCPSDVQQGQLGNCWLISALSLISERPQMLEHILLTKKINHVGVYLVRICHNGLWKIILIDDCFPCTNQNTFAFSQGKKRQLYVPLIEKACAKIFGSYSNLRGGSTAEGLQLLTGAPCHKIQLNSSDQILDFDLIWAQLLSASESKLLMGASTGRSDVSMIEYDRIGIHGNHAFSIVLVKSLDKDSIRILLIGDPHGKTNYRDLLIESSKRKEFDLLYKKSGSSGMFWISWWNFLRYFDSITISTYINNHFDIRQVSQFSKSSRDSISSYYFYLKERSSIHISILYHREDRKKGHYHTQSFVLCRVNNERKLIDSNEIILQSSRGGFVHWSGLLKEGYYILIPFSISFWTMNSNDEMKRTFTLVIHSTIELNGTFIDETSSFLSNCLINAIIKYSKQIEKDEYSTFYVTSEEIGSKMIVVENVSPRKYLNVIIDVNEAKNVRHSRYSLLTNDFIPPYHRQLICILEWTNEEGQSARISYTRTQAFINSYSNSIPFIHQNDLHSPLPIQ